MTRRRGSWCGHADAPAQQAKALDLYQQVASEQSGVVSTQVLQEYFVASTRKLGVYPELTRREVQLFGRLRLVVLSEDLQSWLAMRGLRIRNPFD